MADKHLVFVTAFATGDDGAIHAFRLDTGSGGLEPLHRTGDLDNAFFIALSPDRKYLYAAVTTGDFDGAEGQTVAFEIVEHSGELKELNRQPSKGLAICYVQVDPTGKAVVIANYTSGDVGSYPVQADGSLGEMQSFFRHEGASLVNAARQETAHAHCAEISPDGNYMYACDLGTDQIRCYRLDAATATLTPSPQPYVRTVGGGGPRHFTFHPNGRFAYANNELANSVNVFSYCADTGILIERQVISSLPDDFDGESYTADIKISPCGSWLYCTNRLHDSIAVYSIGEDGCLTLVEIVSGRGNYTQNLAITPDGGILLAANVDSQNNGGANLVAFRINGDTGCLTAVGEAIPLPHPSCIMIV